MMDEDDEGGEAWSDILARRSPEGRAIVDELISAEQTVLAIQARIMTAIKERRDCADDYEAIQAAIREVERLQKEVYRLARQ